VSGLWPIGLGLMKEMTLANVCCCSLTKYISLCSDYHILERGLSIDIGVLNDLVLVSEFKYGTIQHYCEHG